MSRSEAIEIFAVVPVLLGSMAELNTSRLSLIHDYTGSFPSGSFEILESKDKKPFRYESLQVIPT
jgi:hypothetical protein